MKLNIPAGLSSDLGYYSAHFMDLEVWQPAVHLICRQHSLPPCQVEAGVPGTFPTFIVHLETGKTVVVKFFGPLFDGVSASKVELWIGNFLAEHPLPIRSPAILAGGSLDNTWHYILYEGIPGRSIGQVRQQLTNDDWQQVAGQVGVFLRKFHDFTAELPGDLSFLQDGPAWSSYLAFLRSQADHCLTNHTRWDDLPSGLLEQIPAYLLPPEKLVDLSSSLHLIHADLTADHLLGRLVPKLGPVSLPSGHIWESLAVIDWGDARVGNILYELVALHMDLFQQDTRLLKICLDAYGLPDFFARDFARKAMNLVLLHQFPMPAQFYAGNADVQTLDELAGRLFGVIE